MKKHWLTAVAVAIALFAVSNTAKADASSCVESSSVDCFTLGVQNGGLTGTGPWGYVQVTLVNSSTVTIEFTSASGYEFHNAGIGWNQSDSASISSTVVSTCTTVGGASCTLMTDTEGGYNFDGFDYKGTGYDESVTGGNGSSSGLTDVIITISGTNLTLADFEGDNGNAQFVAQVAPFQVANCTGFVGNENLAGNQPSSTLGAGCSTSQVPEPGSLMLFGTGLLGMAGFIRRKLMA